MQQPTNAFSFATTAQLVMAPGASEQLGEQARALGMSRVMLVTDPGIVQAGLIDAGVAALKQAGIEVITYTEIVADPPESVVLEALAVANDAGVDGVIGLGGGSSMDAAKLVAVLAKGEQTLSDIYGVGNITSSRLPLIQIPTTAGTGSEVTPIAIVTTGETTKMGVVSPVLLADAVILDPVLTLGLPPQVTAATGIDAMVHCIEAYTSIHRKNPLSDMLAREGLRLLADNIRTAVYQGDDLEARANMLLGAMLAGQAFANAPVAAVHALAYPLGGVYHIPHGLSNSLVLPHVLQFNLDAAADLYAELAPIIMVGQSVHQDQVEAATQLADYLYQLAIDLGLPVTLRDMNIEESALPRLAADAMEQQRLLVNNPREVTLDDALAIYQAAY